MSATVFRLSFPVQKRQKDPENLDIMNEALWIYMPPQNEAKALASQLDISLEMAQILVNRGIDSADLAQEFLFGTWNDLYDPFLMDGMTGAVDRIRKAISNQEKILIFGDYDVDGILSVVILIKALHSLGACVDYFIPDRLKEGYGIKEKYTEIAQQKKATVVISVDCGIKAIPFVKKAREKGIDVIITDHHQPGPDLPEALAILNPVLPGSGYPYKNLAGIGVVFKLIQALFTGEKESSVLPHYLKLVSIGTIADVTELRDENRIFVKLGLKGLEELSNKGLRCLMEFCGLGRRKVTVGDIGFRIGPRINAAGRMGKTDLAVKLFLSDSYDEVEDIAGQLERLNARRQRVEEKMYTEAVTRIQENSLDKRYKLLVMGCEEWHKGVLGIVASKLKDRFHRPVILFCYKDGNAYGSGRSIPEFSLIECLEGNRDFFISYGGHTMAVGCVLACHDIPSFREQVNTFSESRITDDDLRKKIHIDTKLDFGNIDIKFLEDMERLSPFGVGNPKPILMTEKAEVISEPHKLQGKHCKFLARQQGRAFEALFWRRGDLSDRILRGDRLDLAYTLQTTSYLGEERLSLNLVDIKKS
jgi:single-stranded-DNA-specific exonuclease